MTRILIIFQIISSSATTFNSNPNRKHYNQFNVRLKADVEMRHHVRIKISCVDNVAKATSGWKICNVIRDLNVANYQNLVVKFATRRSIVDTSSLITSRSANISIECNMNGIV